MKALLARVDWARPWLAPYRAIAESLESCAGEAASVAQLLGRAAVAHGPVVLAAGELRFVAPAAMPRGEAYEAFIARTACVPTRDNLHDLFNGLVWLRFPQVKRRLNELQAEQIAALGVGDRRGPVRDALTLFDENGAWLQAPAVLAEALQARDWQALFVTHRAAWQHARLTLFGHALLEKLCAPRPAVTAHGWLLPAEVAGIDAGADVPSQLLAELSPALLAAWPHPPLPVLGVPDWWPANAEPAFYNDASVFRPARAAAPGRGEIRA